MSNIDDLCKRHDVKTRNRVRIHIKPVHVLAIMLILVVCLACSLTMLISQYVTYSKVYSYQAVTKSKNHSNKQVDFYNKSDTKDNAKDGGKDDAKDDGKSVLKSESKGESNNKSKVSANHKSELKKDEESVENVSKNQDLIEKNKSEYSQNRSKNIQNKSECININTSGLEELQAIKGIGPKMAQRILDTRKKLRVFKRVEDLMQVKGIGQKTFLKLKSMVCVA